MTPDALVRGSGTGLASPAPVPADAGARFSPRFLLAALLLGAGAFALRLHRLAEWSLETDEAFTIHDALHTLGRGGTGTRFPVGYAFERWVLGGEGPAREFEARIGSAAAGAAAVTVAALAFAPVVGPTAALVGAAGLAIAPWHVYWSQFARYYALLVFLVVAALGFLYRGFDRARLRWLLPGGAFLALATATHPSAALLCVSLAPLPFFFTGLGGFAARARFTRARAILLASAALAVAVAVHPIVRDAFAAYRGKKSPSVQLFVATVSYWARPPLLAVAALAVLEGIRRRHRGVVFLALASFGPIGVGFVASFFVRANAQYIVYALPALLALVAWAGLEVARAGRRLLAAGLLAAVGADLVGETVLYLGPHRGHRPAWREASAFVRARAGEGDAVVSTQAPIVEYYLQPGFTRLREPERVYWLSQYEYAGFEARTSRAARIWYLVNDADLDDWPRALRERFRERLSERAHLVAEWPLRIVTDDLGVKVYREDP